MAAADPKEPSLRRVPELPHRLVDMWPVAYVGTSLWASAFVIMLIFNVGQPGPPNVWFWTTLAGVVLGFIGMAIMAWQHASHKRGSKSAQRGI